MDLNRIEASNFLLFFSYFFLAISFHANIFAVEVEEEERNSSLLTQSAILKIKNTFLFPVVCTFAYITVHA